MKSNIIKKNNLIIKLEIYHENNTIIIKRDKDWNINITALAKSPGKNWQDWYKYRKKKKVQSGIEQVICATPGRYGFTWITFELAIQVLNSWNHSLAYQLSLHKKRHVMSLQKQVRELNLFIKNQKQKKRRYLFGEGSCIYCYTTNGLRKVGRSGGKHKRIRNHETSVGRFAFDWFFFTEQAKEVEKSIGKRFTYPEERPRNNRDHFFTPAEKLKEFVISYLELMNYPYTKVFDEELKLYADSV